MKKASIFWFTGLSGSGKSTIAQSTAKELRTKNLSVLVLDGDEVRSRIHKKLTFSEEDIKTNNRLISEICQQQCEKYDVILVPIISPYRESRQKARELLGENFYEIYFSASLETVIKRDTKGLYAKAQKGEIDNLIGYSSKAVYQKPLSADFVADSENVSIEEITNRLYEFIVKKKFKLIDIKRFSNSEK